MSEISWGGGGAQLGEICQFPFIRPTVFAETVAGLVEGGDKQWPFGIPAESFTRWDVLCNLQTNANPDEKKSETPRWQEFDNTTKV